MKQELKLEVGDLVFIRCKGFLFRQVADATGSWTNHVGVVIGHDGLDWRIAESRVPLSCTTSLTRFVARSEHGRFAVRRLPQTLSTDEVSALRHACRQRLGVPYHTGFKLRSRRQFCSKFAHEVYRDALGITLGTPERFGDLLQRNPRAHQRFWRLWFFGRIPWHRETITPASQYTSDRLRTVIDEHGGCASRHRKTTRGVQ